MFSGWLGPLEFGLGLHVTFSNKVRPGDGLRLRRLTAGPEKRRGGWRYAFRSMLIWDDLEPELDDAVSSRALEGSVLR